MATSDPRRHGGGRATVPAASSAMTDDTDRDRPAATGDAAMDQAKRDQTDARTAAQVAAVLRHRAIQASYSGGDTGPAFAFASVFDLLSEVLLREDDPPASPAVPRMPPTLPRPSGRPGTAPTRTHHTT